MDDLGVGSELRQLAGHPVVEPGPHRDEDVGLGHGHIGAVGAVHAQHPHPQGVVAGESAQAHEGAGHRDLQARGELVEFLRAVRQHDAAPGIEHRPLGVEDHVQRPVHLPGIGMVGGVVALDLDGLGKLGHRAGLTHILGQVHQHRPRPPGPGDIKGLVDASGPDP